MQVGLLNHLKYPKGSEPPLASTGEGSTAPTKPGLGATVRQMTPAQDAPGVVLKLQSGEGDKPGLALAKGLVYSNGRKASAAADTEGAGDTERQALQHSQALQRSAGAATHLHVDKDGVLVAQPALDAQARSLAKREAKADSRSEDFVQHAVGAMREYADAQERLKTAGRSADSATGAGLIPRGMEQVQKLAARFNLFT